MTAESALYRVSGLRKSYDGHAVLNGVDFEVHRGESLVILGRSGSGKSVTLRQLIGLEPCDAGSVVFDGQDITHLPEPALQPMRRRVSMLFQSGALFDSLTVFENVAYPLRERGEIAEEQLAAKVRDTLELVQLEDADEKLPSELSGGMRKRAALARSLVADPEVVLFDEPTTGLDPMTAATIGALIVRAREKLGVTSVIVTHDLALVRRVAERVAFLEEGKLRFIGTLAEAESSGDPLLQHFLAGEEEDDAA
jgi:ABC-type transporter Mla maintaining outer membrane lipid asymmetry ATPase subunit MlaF